jgi:hypothetical protein
MDFKELSPYFIHKDTNYPQVNCAEWNCLNIKMPPGFLKPRRPVPESSLFNRKS